MTFSSSYENYSVLTMINTSHSFSIFCRSECGVGRHLGNVFRLRMGPWSCRHKGSHPANGRILGAGAEAQSPIFSSLFQTASSVSTVKFQVTAHPEKCVIFLREPPVTGSAQAFPSDMTPKLFGSFPPCNKYAPWTLSTKPQGLQSNQKRREKRGQRANFFHLLAQNKRQLMR